MVFMVNLSIGVSSIRRLMCDGMTGILRSFENALNCAFT
jgi:hypothetical protein